VTDKSTVWSRNVMYACMCMYVRMAYTFSDLQLQN